MSVEFAPGTLASKAYETIALLETKMDKSSERSSLSPFDRLVVNTRNVASYIFVSSVLAGTYYVGKSLFTFSTKPLSHAKVCGVGILVYIIFVRIFCLPYLKELALTQSSIVYFIDFIDASFDFWKKNIFQISHMKNRKEALSDFLLCLTAKEGSKETSRRTKYLKLLNMTKEEAVEAVALVKIAYSILCQLHTYNMLPSSQSLPEGGQKLPIQIEAEKVAEVIERDLGFAALDPDLKERIQSIVQCFKKDITVMQHIIDREVPVRITYLDSVYFYNKRKEQAPD